MPPLTAQTEAITPPLNAEKVQSTVTAPRPYQAYLDWLKHSCKLSPHSLAAYARDLADLCAMHPKLPLAQLTTLHIRNSAVKLHAQNLQAKSIARKLSAWRGFYDWLAAQTDPIEAALVKQHNPVKGVRAPRAQKRLPKALTVDDTRQLLEPAIASAHPPPFKPASTSLKKTTEKIRDAAMYELLYSSGLRLSELIDVDVHYVQQKGYASRGWIDFEAGDITVTGKGNKRRMVPVGAHALRALQAWLEVRMHLLNDTHHPALFISARGERMSPRTLQHRLNLYAIAQGLQNHVHPHVLRHSFASHVLQSSGDLRAVQDMLGHASIRATQVYTSLDFQHLAATYDKAHPRAKRVEKPVDNKHIDEKMP